MAGRWTASEEQLRPDPKYGSKVLARFINCVMYDGKKSTALRIVYEALAIIEKRNEGNAEFPGALKVFEKAVSNVKPEVEVRSKRVGGANYQVPMSVKPRRRQSLAFRWILDAVRTEKGKGFAQKLAKEISDAAANEGKAINTREQTHRMAEANKAFAHFAW